MQVPSRREEVGTELEQSFQDSAREYFRQLTLRDPSFKEDLKQLKERWPSPPCFPPPQTGLKLQAINQWQDQQRAYMADLMRLQECWSSVALEDIAVLGDPSKHHQLGPKVRLAPYPLWPKDGSMFLQVHPMTTADEFKRAFQTIKRKLGLVRHRKATLQTQETSPMVRLVQHVGLSGNELIFVSVTPTATGDDAKREFHKIKRAVSRRRLRLGSLQLKLSVYDMYVDKGKSFRQIARVVGKHPSTVFDLFVSVCRDMGTNKKSSREMRFDPLFDHQEHFSTCLSCQKGWACKLAAEKIGLPSLNPMLSKIPYDDKVDIVTLQNQGRKPRRKIEY